MKSYPLSLGNMSKDFAVNSMLKTGLNGCVYNFSVDCNTIDINHNINIHKYLNEKTRYKIMLGFFQELFIRLLSICTVRMFNRSLASNFEGRIKYVSLNN